MFSNVVVPLAPPSPAPPALNELTTTLFIRPVVPVAVEPGRRGTALALGAVLTLSALLAGCVDDVAPAGTAVDAVNGTDLSALAPPDNRSGDFNAFEETNVTETGAGGVDHHHDYWLGRDRVELFTGRYEMNPAPDPAGSSTVFNMPAGALVFEGTATVEFLVAKPQRHACYPGLTLNTRYICTDGNGAGAPAGPPVDDPAPPTVVLEYQHASSGRDEWTPAGTLEWGTPLQIPVKAIETDMPHSTTSLWRYRVVSADPLSSTLTFEAAATIVRGADVPLWPAHPDFYAERSSRVVYDGPSSTREAGSAGTAFGFNDSLIQETPGRLISYGTRSVHVWINVTKLDAPPTQGPSTWYLYYHNATGDWLAAGLGDAENNSIDTKELHFIVPVTDDGMDSPYAPDSRWEFLLRGTYDTPVGLTCYSGCATYAVEYNMFIVATDREAEAYSPLSDVN